MQLLLYALVACSWLDITVAKALPRIPPPRQEAIYCARGFKKNTNGVCVDMNECLLFPGNCGTGGKCINTLGGFRCEVAAVRGVDGPVATAPPLVIDKIVKVAIDCWGLGCGEQSITQQAPTTSPMPTSTDDEFATPMPPILITESPCGGGYDKSIFNQTGTIVGTCIDINECQRYPSNCQHGVCVNTEGGFHCEQCQQGYKLAWGNTACDDINECNKQEGDCAHGKCINTPGGFHCTCSRGWVQNMNKTACLDVDECMWNPCGNHGTCINKPGSYDCGCDKGYEQISLDKAQKTCQLDPCQGGTMTDAVGTIKYPLAGRYKRNKRCKWVIKAGKLQTITLRVTKMNIEGHKTCRWDWLKLENVQDKYYSVKLCDRSDAYKGFTRAGGADTFKNFGQDQVNVEFRSDSSQEGRGFILEWRLVDGIIEKPAKLIQKLNETVLLPLPIPDRPIAPRPRPRPRPGSRVDPLTGLVREPILPEPILPEPILPEPILPDGSILPEGVLAPEPILPEEPAISLPQELVNGTLINPLSTDNNPVEEDH